MAATACNCPANTAGTVHLIGCPFYQPSGFTISEGASFS